MNKNYHIGVVFFFLNKGSSEELISFQSTHDLLEYQYFMEFPKLVQPSFESRKVTNRTRN